MPREKTKLAFIFYNMGLGGIQRKIVDLINYIYQNGLSEKIEPYLLYTAEADFDFLNQLDPEFKQLIRPKAWKIFKKTFYFPSFIQWGINILKFDINLVLSHVLHSSIRSVFLSKLFFWKKIEVFISQDNIFSYENPRFYQKVLGKIFYPAAKAIIVQNQVAKQDLIDYLNISADKIFVVPNWVVTNFKNTKKNSKSKAKKADKKIFDLLFIGRFAPQKNLLTLIKVVKELKKNKKDISLLMVGEGKEEQSLKKYVKSNKLVKNVRFAKPNRDVASFYAQSKIFVLSSKYEGQPVVLLEAWSTALPAVVMNYPGLKLYFHNQEAGLIAYSIKDMSDKIILLLKNNSLRKKLGLIGQRRVKKDYNVTNLEKYFEILGLCLN